MSILFSVKAFSAVIGDKTYPRYSDPSLNELLGTAEKYFLAAKLTYTGTGTSLTVTIETSNDNVNWVPRTAAINTAIPSGEVRWGSDFAGGSVVGRFARYSLQLSSAQAASAYAELWVTGRDAR